MTKGKRHFGNVRKRDSGRWQATYWLNGERRSAPTTYPTKSDALAYLATVEADLVRGQWVDPRAGATPFREYAEHWLAAGGTRATMRESTQAKYRGLLDRHLLPTFGALELSRVRPAQVAAWHSELAKRHPSTAAGAYRLLATVFNTAVRDEMILRSPCKVPGASQEHAAERPTATITECQRSIDAMLPKYRAALRLAAWGQLRRGEVLALQRRNVDLASGTVKVERDWTVTEDGTTVLGPPKSDAGRRTLYLPDDATKALETHLATYVGAEPDAWLFPGRSGLPVHPRTFTHAWERARVKAGRTDLHVHDLRHSGLTWVAQAGATTAELMRRAGHASPAAALRYQHAADERDKSLAEALGRMTNPTPTGTAVPVPARGRSRPQRRTRRSRPRHAA